MVGHSNDCVLYICGQKTNALIDTGSMVTCISENFYESLEHKPVIRDLQDFQLNVYGAGGNVLPFLGYIEAEVRIPCLTENPFFVPVLVRKLSNSDNDSEIPVIIGTNVIRSCKEMVSELDCSSNIPEVWNLAFKSMCKKDLKVRSTNHFPISIGPNEVKTLHGLVRKSYDLETALTEQSDTSQSGSLVICPRVIRLKSSVGKVSRIPVRVCNLSAQSIKILPKSVICSVSPVKVIDSWEPETEEVSSVTKGENSDIFVETIGSKINRQNLTENELVRTSEVLNRWKHIFSTSFTDIGRTDLVKHEIKLTDNIPVKEPYRRIPPGMYEEVRQHLKEMLEAGAIRKSQSSYCSNVVLVKKSDGSLRFCIDLRKLNNKTIKDAYTLPRVEETIDTLIGSKYFTKLDLRSGYWQVEIKEEDKHKTAFSLGPLGFYECNRMAFGLTNAPATFQRLMETCMGDLHLRECLIFLDDILVFSQSFDDHLKRLEGVFEKLEKHNLKLKPSKCEFFMSEVKYLGHIVSEEGVKTDPDKIEALKSWPVPRNIKELRSFLGFTGYYRRFIKDYARVVHPLTELLAGHSTAKGKNKENYVDKLKKRLDYAYKVARANTERNSERSKRHYDFRVRNSKLEIGDRVLIRLLHKTGRSKLSDKWERDPYVIVDMPNPDIPVYKVQKESKKGAIRTLHRNLILPFMSISDTVDTEFPKESDRQHKRRDRRQKVLAESESTSSDSSEDDDDDDSEFTYMVKKRSGKENIPKGTPNTSRIYHGNDSSESFGATGNHNFDISGADNIDVGRGNSITTQFDSSTVELDHGFPIHSVDLSRSGLSHNSYLSLPNIDDDVLPDTNVFIPRRSIRERNKPDRYGEWVLGSQPVEVWYV